MSPRRPPRPAAVCLLIAAVCLLIAGCAAPDPPAPRPHDVFDTGFDPGLPADPAVWVAWSVVNHDGRRTGSPNATTDRTNAESTIKAWIVADRIRVDNDAGRPVTTRTRTLIGRAIQASDDQAAEQLYRGLGGDDDVLDDLAAVCGVRVDTDRRGYWSYTQITAADATRILGCVLDQAPRYRDGALLVDALHHVDPGGAFGIPEALPPGTAVAVKNGWTAHGDTAQWNVNCVAAWNSVTLAVLTRYPIERGQGYGAGICRQVTAAFLAAGGT